MNLGPRMEGLLQHYRSHRERIQKIALNGPDVRNLDDLMMAQSLASFTIALMLTEEAETKRAIANGE